MPSKIVFCTTNKNRTQHLELTLPKNIVDNRSALDRGDCKFVVLDYNSTDHLRDYLQANHGNDIENGHLVVYSMLPGADGPIPFNMTHSKNMAHRCGILEGANILVNLDADNYTCEVFAEYVDSEMDADTYLWARMKKGQFRRGISGRIVVTSRAFMKLGGYDEKYETWSPDDKDFNARLVRLGYSGKEIDERYLDAISHNDKMRFREYPHVQNGPDGEQDLPIACDTTIVNFGEFGMGTVYRNFDFSNPINLGPLPTRIFGIGMHKTATTSLHAALGMLDYDSEHWKSAHWAKAIYTEMTRKGRSLTLEKSYAVCDLPITILYEELDKAYPGSRFILTVRDEAKWLESVRRHWSREKNPFRSSWDRDPFTHFIHKLVYGRRDFDAETFLERYRRHNAEVKEYFKGRPGDLLVFNMNGDDGWAKLCNFLGRQVPEGVVYPVANRNG